MCVCSVRVSLFKYFIKKVISFPIFGNCIAGGLSNYLQSILLLHKQIKYKNTYLLSYNFYIAVVNTAFNNILLFKK